MAMREYEDGHYWVQLSPDDDPEVAFHQHGVWRMYGVTEPVETGDFYRIGRPAAMPADVFQEEVETDGEIGV